MLVILVEQLGFRLADAEYATTARSGSTRHASHQEEPDEDNQHERSDRDQEAPEKILALLEPQLGIDLVFLNGLVIKVRKFVSRRDFHVDFWRRTDLGRIHILENSRYLVGLDGCLGHPFLVVDRDILEGVLLDILLELCPVQVFRAGRIVGHVKGDEHDENQPIHPIQIETERVRLVALFPGRHIKHVLLVFHKK